MRRIVTYLLPMIMAFTLSACSSGQKDDSENRVSYYIEYEGANLTEVLDSIAGTGTVIGLIDTALFVTDEGDTLNVIYSTLYRDSIPCGSVKAMTDGDSTYTIGIIDVLTLTPDSLK